MRTGATLVIMVLFAALFAFGCVSLPKAPALPAAPVIMPGSDRDSHGCIPSAGYEWCDALGKCIRPWEENCTAQVAGSLKNAPPLLILTESFPPFNFLDANGSITGQSTDILKEIMARTGQQGQVRLMSWPDAYSLAANGTNTMLYSTDRKPERDQFFKWAGPIGGWEYDFYARNDSAPYSTLSSAKQAGKVCVVQNDSRQQFLDEAGFANLQTVSDDASCAAMLAGGAVDLWLGSSTSFAGVMARANIGQSAFKAVLPVNRNDLYFAFSKDVPDSTVQAWQNALDAMKADGTFQAIAAKYGAGNGAQTGFLAGNDSDAHGCKGSAGYTWCETKQKCIRVWEEGCPATTLEAKAQSYCGKENVDSVYVCGDYVKVVSSLMGGGSTFYPNGAGNPIVCPVISPEYMPADCGELLSGKYCNDTKVC